jgi:hypothetical protein
MHHWDLALPGGGFRARALGVGERNVLRGEESKCPRLRVGTGGLDVSGAFFWDSRLAFYANKRRVGAWVETNWLGEFDFS